MVVEPNISNLPDNLKQKNIQLVNLSYAINNSNILLILVDHKEFKNKVVFSNFNGLIVDTKGLII